MCLGIPGQIVEIVDADAKLVTVDVGGVKRAVNVAFIVGKDHPVESCVGDWVLVHVGFAMIRIDEQEAAATLGLPAAACREYLERECLYEPGARMGDSLRAFRDLGARAGVCDGTLDPPPIALGATVAFG